MFLQGSVATMRHSRCGVHANE